MDIHPAEEADWSQNLPVKKITVSERDFAMLNREKPHSSILTLEIHIVFT